MAEGTVQHDFDYCNYILKHFKYHPNGTLTRDDRKNSLGVLDKDGYLRLKIKKKVFLAHRIVWFLNNGQFPDGEIDHINRIRTDNRIENLRIADRITQCRNTIGKINPITGVKGIYYDKTKGLRAVYAFRCLGKTYRFRNLNDAVNKRKELRGEL